MDKQLPAFSAGQAAPPRCAKVTAVVIYGDLLTPHHMNRLDQATARDGLSSQLRRLVIAAIDRFPADIEDL